MVINSSSSTVNLATCVINVSSSFTWNFERASLSMRDTAAEIRLSLEERPLNMRMRGGRERERKEE